MHRNEISVYRLAGTTIDRKGAADWLENEFKADEPCHQDITNAGILIGLAGKRCYLSFKKGLNPNVTKIREDWVEYLDNILASGHGSVLEHASFTYAIEGVTRVFTGEMNRHRAGVAISEGSMRYIRFDDIGYWEPFSIRENNADDPKLANKKQLTRLLFQRAFQNTQEIYAQLEGIWREELAATGKEAFKYKKELTSMFRRIVPMGCSTGGVWTFNVRALRHVIALRSTPHAEEEIAFVVGLIAKDMFIKEPQLFGDFIQTELGFWVPKYNKV